MQTRMLMLTIVALACGCAEGTGADPGPGQNVPVERRVDPSATGAGITNTTGQHFVVAPGGSSPSPTLLVFLPGTGGRPDFYTTFLRHAGALGQHAIGLAYPNAVSVADLCT